MSIEPLADPKAEAVRAFLATDAAGEVLQLMVYSTCPVAHLFRDSGVEIPRKTELEHAWTVRWLLDLVLEHGPGWREVASERLAAIRADIVAAADAEKAEQ